jgi:isocitrate dehydrogenase kinase/phosphatase
LLRVKEHYTHLLPDYPRFEIAESFFNSVYCRLFDHRSLTPSGSLFSARSPSVLSHPSATAGERFLSDRGWSHLLGKVLSDLPLRLPWQNKARDIGYIIASLQEALGRNCSPPVICRSPMSCSTAIKPPGWWANW